MISRYSARILWGIFGVLMILGSFGCAPKFTVTVSVEPQGAGYSTAYIRIRKNIKKEAP